MARLASAICVELAVADTVASAEILAVPSLINCATTPDVIGIVTAPLATMLAADATVAEADVVTVPSCISRTTPSIMTSVSISISSASVAPVESDPGSWYAVELASAYEFLTSKASNLKAPVPPPRSPISMVCPFMLNVLPVANVCSRPPWLLALGLPSQNLMAPPLRVTLKWK